MAVSHSFSNAVANWTGTVTAFNSQGSTTTVAATNLVRPQDWNSVHNEFFTLSGNTNNASTASGSNIVFQGLGGVTMVGSTGTIGISAPVSQANYPLFHPFSNAAVATSSVQGGTLIIVPITVPYPGIQHDRIACPISYSNATNSSNSWTLSSWFGLYSNNNSTLSLISSTSSVWSSTNSGTVGNYSLGSGVKALTIPWTNTITGGLYYIGVVGSQSSNAGGFTIGEYFGNQSAATAFSGIFGASNNLSNALVLGSGVYSSTTQGMPPSIPFSSIVGSDSKGVHPPTIIFQSGTA